MHEVPRQSIIREVGLELCNIQWEEIIERKGISDVEILHSKKGGNSLISKYYSKEMKKKWDALL